MRTENWDLAEVKAELASHGVSLHPSARLMQLDGPERAAGGIAVVILERVADVPEPNYCLHGFASCISCGEICYLSSESSKRVQADTYPLCLSCGTDMQLAPEQLVDQMEGQ